MTRLLIGIVLLLPLAALAAGQIYRTTDAEGNVVFTDAPPANSGQQERVDIGHINTAPPPPARPEPPAPAKPDADEATGYSVSITAPGNETTIPMGGGIFAVSAAVKPELGEDDSLVLTIDGTPWGDPQRDPQWQLTNIFRGAHDLVVSVIDADGETLATSQPVRVYVLRPSVLRPNRAN